MGRWGGLLLAVLAGVGCRQPSAGRAAGSDLPTTSERSVALPGATDAADAPHAPQVVESRGATLTTYQDPVSGVSFQYPADWRPAVAGVSPVSPGFEAVAGKARMTQEFLPTGTPYASTALRALMFSYTVKEESQAERCAGLAGKTVPGGQGSQASFGGMTFTEVKGDDGSACTQVRHVVDTALEGRRCFVFERDLVTGCPDVKTGAQSRPLTAAEQTGLERQLDAVMGSVRLAGR